MSEYIIVVLLVAIGTIGVISIFGWNLRTLFADSSTALAGNDKVDNTGMKSVSGAHLQKKLRNAGINSTNGGTGSGGFGGY